MASHRGGVRRVLPRLLGWLIFVACLACTRMWLYATITKESSNQKPQSAAPPRTNDGRNLLELVAGRHPINRLQCGQWVARYKKLHHAIMDGTAPQRFTIMRSKQEFGNGLADRLASSVSILLYAILTNRAFLYDWDPPPPPPGTPVHEGCGGMHQKHRPSTPLWKALRSDFIDWRFRGVPEAESSTLLMDYVCDKGMDEYRAMFASQNLTAVGDGYQSVVWYTDHAGVYSAFNNPHLRDTLSNMGLQQDTAFACLFDFLYRPAPEVISIFQPELRALLDPNAFKVGIQIRVGDWQLVSASSYFFQPQHFPSLFRHYFECAEEVQQSQVRPGQPVIWYLLTDVLDLRPRLKARFGKQGRILTNTSIAIEHTVKAKAQSDISFLQAVGELWLFSLTDHHILTRTSGYGKVGAMLSAAGTSHIYQVFQPMNFFNLVALSNRKEVFWWRSRKCTPEFADPLPEVCTDFTGI